MYLPRFWIITLWCVFLFLQAAFVFINVSIGLSHDHYNAIRAHCAQISFAIKKTSCSTSARTLCLIIWESWGTPWHEHSHPYQPKQEKGNLRTPHRSRRKNIQTIWLASSLINYNNKVLGFETVKATLTCSKLLAGLKAHRKYYPASQMSQTQVTNHAQIWIMLRLH